MGVTKDADSQTASLRPSADQLVADLNPSTNDQMPATYSVVLGKIAGGGMKFKRRLIIRAKKGAGVVFLP